MSRRNAFAAFGTRARNDRWSWSARSDDGRTVVVVLWQDYFTSEAGRRVYERPGFDPKYVDARLGFRELMDNLAWARDHCDGRFHVVVAIAKDCKAEPRSIQECFASKLVMELTHLDAATGAFRAVSVSS
ncbi:hypothetical protein ACTZWW_18110 [Salinarimonas sp. NSM]|uniref:hypothetical protein n=1 Tax=Salinarimonas sp. NSM TaxID=3458003 RepID=UPI00403649F5